ncbi:MAG: hypothetical protein WC796_02180 [Candidatus Pacearchaeota archaeon]|jgi:hypothetical protein
MATKIRITCPTNWNPTTIGKPTSYSLVGFCSDEPKEILKRTFGESFVWGYRDIGICEGSIIDASWNCKKPGKPFSTLEIAMENLPRGIKVDLNYDDLINELWKHKKFPADCFKIDHSLDYYLGPCSKITYEPASEDNLRRCAVYHLAYRQYSSLKTDYFHFRKKFNFEDLKDQIAVNTTNHILSSEAEAEICKVIFRTSSLKPDELTDYIKREVLSVRKAFGL